MLDSAYDGVSISVAAVRPESRPKAVLQISHGMCGCKERFLPFMEYMAAHGVACVANDHRGHGLSVKNEKDRGYMYIGGYKALVDDMKMVTDWTRKSFEDVPVFLLGHSMDSLAAGTYLKKHSGSVDGVILCGNPSWKPLSYVILAFMHLLCMPMPEKEKLQNIKVPVLYMLGGPEDIAYENGMDDFHRLVKVPAFAANYPVGHGGTYRQPYGGEFTVPALAWLKLQLQDDDMAAKMFIGFPCELERRKGWTIEKNDLID